MGLSRLARIVLITEFILTFANGITGPIFSLFIKDDLIGGSNFAASISISIYVFSVAISQLFLAKAGNKIKNKTKTLFLGLWGLATVNIAFAMITTVEQSYIVQIFSGFFAGFNGVLFLEIFSNSGIMKDSTRSWGKRGTILSISTGIAVLIGGYITQTLGFKKALIFVATLMYVSSIPLLLIKNKKTNP